MIKFIKKNFFLYIFAALLTAAYVASVRSASAADIIQQEDKVTYKKKTSIDFSDVTIKGELTKPEGSYVGVRKGIKFKNFIKVRADFRDKISESVDNI